MTPEHAAWVCRYVLAPREIPPQPVRCPCQIVSNACEDDRHGECGHTQWIAWDGTEEETVIGRGHGPFPCRGSFGLNRGDATVYLADRECRVWCNCRCHQSAPEPTEAPAFVEQMGLFGLVITDHPQEQSA
ncbi:hypothetical protein ACQZM9_21900 [Streptomyces sp. P11-1]|uniref:hypothetical protein n=1 Tax=Streptomyces sp. P11-1 TaxID=3423221 RepID=UPI003D2EB227